MGMDQTLFLTQCWQCVLVLKYWPKESEVGSECIEDDLRARSSAEATALEKCLFYAPRCAGQVFEYTYNCWRIVRKCIGKICHGRAPWRYSYVEGQISLSSENADPTSEVDQGLIFWGEFWRGQRNAATETFKGDECWSSWVSCNKTEVRSAGTCFLAHSDEL